MVIEFGGFDGLMPVEVWAKTMALAEGAPCTVQGPLDWTTRAVSGQDRMVSCSPGTGEMAGVALTSDDEVTVQLETAVGTPRIDVVAWRINWAILGGAVELVAVKGTADDIFPMLPEPENAPPDPIGAAYGYIPLSMWRVTPGVQTPELVRDLRQWASKAIYTPSLAGVINPPHGCVATLTGDGSSYRYDAVGMKWNPVLDRKLWWAGYMAELAGNTTYSFSGTGRYYYAPWRQFSSMGNVTMSVSSTPERVTRIQLPAGAYTIQSRFNNVMPDASYIIHVDPTEALATVKDAPLRGGRIMMNNPNGAAATLQLNQPSSVVIGWYISSGRFDAGPRTYLTIRRDGDA